MGWVELHKESEGFAQEAERCRRLQDFASASQFYRKAAELETQAFAGVEQGKARTIGILGVSAAALWLKAREIATAERFSLLALSRPDLPPFARSQLRQILQDAWIEQDKTSANVQFLPGQVEVSVRGGQVVYGGAPLDLIVEKVKSIQALFYRTIEHIKGEPLRRRGNPKPEIMEACQPWLFQSAPGSYQFSVAVQKPAQPDFFREDVQPEQVVAEFLGVLSAGASNDMEALRRIVPDEGYRGAFVRLTRNLAPSGKRFEVLEVRAMGDQHGVVLGVETRAELGRRIRSENVQSGSTGQTDPPQQISGILRALHLDQDWLEISHAAGVLRVYGVQDSLDDVIGPMVNRGVVATVARRGAQQHLIDIELEE